MRQLFFLLTFLIVSASTTIANEITVLSANDGSAVEYAHLKFKSLETGKQLTVYTNSNGQFEYNQKVKGLKLPLKLSISHISHKGIIDTLRAFSSQTYQIQSTEYGLEHVVITAQHHPQNAAHSVHNVRVISKEDVEKMGANNLRDVLRQQLNIRVTQDNILGSGMQLQGVGGRNVKIMIDGVPVIGRQNGNIDLSQLNLNNIERIEIIEGPLSANFGTDALAGTINIITKKDQKDKINGKLNTYYESVGQYNADAFMGYKSGNSIIQLSGGRYAFDGWDPDHDFFRFPEARPADTNRSLLWNPKFQHFGRIQFIQNINKLKLRAYADYFNERISNRGRPQAPYFERALDDEYITNRVDGGLQLSGELNQNVKINTFAAYNIFTRNKYTYVKDLTTLESKLSDGLDAHDTSTFSQFSSRGSIIYSKPKSSLSLQTGYEVNQLNATGSRLDGAENGQTDLALFSTLEYKLSQNLQVRPELRAAYNSNYDAPLISAFHLMYRLDQFKLNASYGRGFRAPSLKEQYFLFVDANHNIQGNENLKAENSHNYNLSISWLKPTANNMIKVKLNGFYNDIDNLITLAQTDEQLLFSYVNIGEFQSLGAQINSSVSGERIELQLGASYTGRSTQNESLDIPPYIYSPEFNGQLSYTFPEWALTMSLFYKYNGEVQGFRETSDGEVVSTVLEAYQTLDASLNKEFLDRSFSITLGAKNLFDVQNINNTLNTGGAHSSGGAQSPVNWGRSLFTSISFNF